MNYNEYITNIMKDSKYRDIFIKNKIGLTYATVALAVDNMLKTNDISDISFIDPFAGCGQGLYAFIDILNNRLMQKNIDEKEIKQLLEKVLNQSALIDVNEKCVELCEYTVKFITETFGIKQYSNIVKHSRCEDITGSTYTICVTNFPFSATAKTNVKDISMHMSTVDRLTKTDGYKSILLPKSFLRTETSMHIRENVISTFDKICILLGENLFDTPNNCTKEETVNESSNSKWTSIAVINGYKRISNHTNKIYVCNITDKMLTDQAINELYMEDMTENIDKEANRAEKTKIADQANVADSLSEEANNNIIAEAAKMALEMMQEAQTIKPTLQPSQKLTEKISILDHKWFEEGLRRLQKLGSLVLNGPAGSGKTYAAKLFASYITETYINFNENMTSYSDNIFFLNANDNVSSIFDTNTQHGVNLREFLSKKTTGKRVIVVNEITKSLNNTMGPIHSATECGNKIIHLWGKELTLTDGTKIVIPKDTYIILVYTLTSAAKPDAQVTDRFGDVLETKSIGEWTEDFKQEVLKLIVNTTKKDKTSIYNYVNTIIQFAQLLESEMISSNINIRKLIDYANDAIDCPFRQEDVDRRLSNKSWISDDKRKKINKVAELGRVYYEATK